ncbi:MAG TPA: HAMP domain-containing sensor histidine kinase [Terriglobales bacterium]
MILITSGLTSLSLLLVRQSVQSEAKQEIVSDLRNSVNTFQSFQREQETTLSRSADLLADLPNLRALMTTNHEATIQDGSTPLWRLAGSDLFVLANPAGKVVALHTSAPGFSREMAQASLASASASSSSSPQDPQRRWWFGARHLYTVFVKPIYFGPASANKLLGSLIIGYEIDDRVASQISRITTSKVAFYYGDTSVTGTLSAASLAELDRNKVSSARAAQPVWLQLGNERFLATTLDLVPPGNRNSVSLTVLKSYDPATAFLEKINRLLLALGLLAVLLGSALVFLISQAFTRPLSSLLAGVSALERGDFTYALDSRGGDEVAELARAFDRMRESLSKTQQNLIEAERLATIGRMASSISHDLRHSLAAIVANAEFLCESQLSALQREELYQEVRAAVGRMTELIDSLLEFSRTPAALRPTYANMRKTLDRAIAAVKSNPALQDIDIRIIQTGNIEGWFDHRKLERAFFNLVLNSCEAVVQPAGRIDIELKGIEGTIEITIADNGRGIPDPIRNTLFDPFVSQGKENGTGLGLTVVQKIVQDHGGDVGVVQTSPEGTAFRVILPRPKPASGTGETAAAGPGTFEETPSTAGAGISSTKRV